MSVPLRLAPEPADERAEAVDLVEELPGDAGADAAGHGEGAADLLELGLVHPTTVANKRSTVLVWCDPPVSGGVWFDRLEPVMTRTGEWALVWTCASYNTAAGSMASLRRGAAGCTDRRRSFPVPPGRWEFRRARVPDAIKAELAGDHGWGVWACYLGAEELADG